MHKLLATLAVLATLVPSLAAARAPSDVGIILNRGRPSRRFIQATGYHPTTQVINKPTITAVRLDGDFRSPEYGIRVSYPVSWEMQSVPQSTPPLTLVVAFLSPAIAGEAVRQNINLVIEDVAADMTLEKYTQQGIQIEKELLKNFELLSTQNISFLSWERATRVRFTAESNGTPLVFEQIWFLRDRKAYVWTYADKRSTFLKNIGTFERMMDSFTVDWGRSR